jgi:exodeoxyribonuclease V gamma subunit
VLRVYTSNALEALAEALASALPAPGAGHGRALFDDLWLLTPSHTVGAFVELALARRRGIASNLVALSLREAVTRLVASTDRDVTVVEVSHWLGELLAVLEDSHQDGVGDRDPLAPFVRYLGAGGADPDARSRRTVQLAQALARLFDDWTETRPGLARAWRAGVAGVGLAGPEEAEGLAVAEAELWRRVAGPGGCFERRGRAEGKRFMTIDQVVEEGLAPAWRPPAQVHLFGFSDLPEAYFPILEALSVRTEVAIYAFNPCREFWEDTDTARAARLGATHPDAPLASLPARPRQAPGDGPDRARGGRGGRRRPGRPGGQLELAGLWATPAEAEAVAKAEPEPTPPRPPADAEGGPRANPLLTLWGRAALPTLRALGQLCDGDFEPRFLEPVDASAPPGLLARLQRDVLDGQTPGRPAARVDLDGSLRVLGALDPRRVWETIAAEIWGMMRADPTLRFCDIAVLLTGAGDADDPYVALGPTVLHEASGLPFTWVSPTLASTSAVGQALIQIFELFEGPFTRREVLDVLTHPNVRERVASLASDAADEIWIALCEALGVAQGADRAAFAGTYVTEDVFNWDQAVRRLALGVFAAGPRSGMETPVGLETSSQAPTPNTRATTGAVAGAMPGAVAGAAAGAGAGLTRGSEVGLVPAEVPPGLRRDADTLALLVRSLIADAAFARSARMSLSGWAALARAVLDAYVRPRSGDDEAARARILAELEALGEAVGPRVDLSLPAATEVLRDALSGLRVARGQTFGAGVAIGTLRALRSIPFRVVFVAGLDADRFPALERRRDDVFDPLAGSEGARPGRPGWWPARRSPRDSDRYLFLEALLAARERLILTCVDRDPFTAEPVLPSAVVLELGQVVERHYGATLVSRAAPGGERLPLHRDENALARAAFPGAAAEFRARAVGEAIRRSVPEAARLGGDALFRALAAEARQALAPLFCHIESLGPDEAAARAPDPAPAPTPSAPPVPAGPPIRVRLADLVRYLQCPLQGSASFFLRLRDVADDGEARDLEDEPVDVPRRVEGALLGETFFEAIHRLGATAVSEGRAPELGRADAPSMPSAATAAAALADSYDRGARRQRFANPRPAGLFQHHLRTRHLERLELWWAGLAPLVAWSAARPRRICFGRPDTPPGPGPRPGSRAEADLDAGHDAGLALELRPALRLTLDPAAVHPTLRATRGPGPITVELEGTTAPLVPLRQGGLAFVFQTLGQTSEQKVMRHRAQALVEAVAFVLSAPATSSPDAATAPSLHSLHVDSDSPRSGRLLRTFHAPTSALEARAYLERLVGDLLSGVQPILFPCEAVDRAMRSGLPLPDQIAFMRGDPFYRKIMSTGWGPVPDPYDYPIPDLATARALRRRRFELALGPEPALTPIAGAGAETEPPPAAGTVEGADAP